jgi:DNA-binding helix-hairpin-helix protein with protein kinase domain
MTTIDTAGGRLGAGGEAEVLQVPGRPDVAYKRYRQPSPARSAKLRVMVRNPPDDRPDIAWPLELVAGAGAGADVDGFLMRRVDLRRNVPVFQVYNPASRRRIAPAITWRYLIRTARNTAAIVDALHRAGYVVGDLNESNLLVDGRAVVTLVDCDSMQVRDPDTGEVFPCAVGKPEFTPPELHRADLATTERTCEGDAFGLAVLVFLLLLEGTHPFAAVWAGAADPPDVAVRIRRRAYPYVWWRRLRHRMAPPPLAVPMRALPLRLRRLMRRAFTTGLRQPSRRPSAAEWVAALDAVEARLHPCRRSAHHLKARRWQRCPWCARADRGISDPFPGPDGAGVTPRRRRPAPAIMGRLPSPPARWVGTACAVVLGAWLPVLTVTAVAARCITQRQFSALYRIAIAVAVAPVAAALVVAMHPSPSAFVLTARLAGMGAAGALAEAATLPGLPGDTRRWTITVMVALVAVSRISAWWWPLGL